MDFKVLVHVKELQLFRWILAFVHTGHPRRGSGHKGSSFEILDVETLPLSHVQNSTAPKIDSDQIPHDRSRLSSVKVAKLLTRLSLRLEVTIDIDEEGLVQIFAIRMLTVLKLSSPILYVKLRLRGLHQPVKAY